MEKFTETEDKAVHLVIAGAMGAAFALWVSASTPWHWLGGFGAAGMGAVMMHRRHLTTSEVISGAIAGSQSILGEVAESAAPITRNIQKQKIELVAAALKQLPGGEVLAQRFISEQGLNSEWFNHFEKRCFVVCGESKDGKTHLLLWRVFRFLQDNPNGRIYICDMDYGRSHDDKEPNTWFDLPVGRVVFIDPKEIYHTIEEVNRQVDKPGNRKEPILLIVDEWVTFYGSLEAEEQKQVLSFVRNIAIRGLKVNVTAVLGLHNLAVNQSGLTVAQLNYFDVLLLWKSSQNVRNYANLGTTDEPGEVIAKIKNLPRVVGDRLRPCVVCQDQQLNLRAVPQLEFDPASVEVIAPEDDGLTEDERWVRDYWNEEKVKQAIVVFKADPKRRKKEPPCLSILLAAEIAPHKMFATREAGKYALLKAKILPLWDTL